MKNNIKVFRVQLNMTQQDLADQVGVTRQTINAIESNKYFPTLELAFKIARKFNSSIEQVFEYEK